MPRFLISHYLPCDGSSVVMVAATMEEVREFVWNFTERELSDGFSYSFYLIVSELIVGQAPVKVAEWSVIPPVPRIQCEHCEDKGFNLIEMEFVNCPHCPLGQPSHPLY